MAQEWIDTGSIKLAPEKAADKKPFEDEVAAASKKYDVPEPWIHAVIQTESKGNPKAWRAEPQKGEGIGSRGLMQIMPATARDLGHKGNLDELYDPKKNIDLGTKYLAQLRDKHGDDFKKVYSAFNSGSAEAYKTKPDVKAHVEAAESHLEVENPWVDVSSIKLAPTAIKAAPAIEKPKIERTAGEVALDQTKSVVSGVGDFVTGIPGNIAMLAKAAVGGPKAQAEVARAILKGGKAQLIDPLSTLYEGAKELIRPGSTTITPDDPRWEEAARAQGSNLAALVAPEVIPPIAKAVGRVAGPYVPSGSVAMQAGKLALKKGAQATAAATLAKIPVAGIPMAAAAEYAIGKATLPELMKIVREYKGDVALKKGLQRAEYIGPETASHVPSVEEIFSGAEEPIDVETQPTSTALTRTGAGPVAPYRGGPGVLTEEQPVITQHERLAAGQLPGSLAGAQKLLRGRAGQKLIQAPTEGATIASQTAPATEAAPTFQLGEAESALPAYYRRQIPPQTETGTSATIGKSVKAPTGEQTITPTPTTEKTVYEDLRSAIEAATEPSTLGKATKKGKLESSLREKWNISKTGRLPYSDWFEKRLTKPKQIELLQDMLDLLKEKRSQ